MSTDINKGRIGAFVCCAILFLIIALILLGKDNLFSNDAKFILFFHGSVSGLNVGAPVVFRGVPLGRVTKISLMAYSNSKEVAIPVTISINKSNVLQDGYGTINKDDYETPKVILDRMVKNGLRARLEMGSLLTGQSRVELDFFPDSVAQYVNKGKLPEIPTISSTKDLFMKELSDLPLNEIADNLLSSLKGISDIVNNPGTIAAVNSLNTTLISGKKLFDRLDLISIDIEKLINSASSSFHSLDKELPIILHNFNIAVTGLSTTFDQFEKTLINAQNVVSPNSVTVRNFNRAMQEFEKASRGVHELANMLERNPESLLLGKGQN